LPSKPPSNAARARRAAGTLSLWIW
jgi:hypothetical protein